MTDEQLRKLTKALVDYKNEYAKEGNEAYTDETYDELMQMLHVGIDACPEMWQYVQEFEEIHQDNPKVENELKDLIHKLNLQIEFGNLETILVACRDLLNYAIDDMPEFFSSEPIVNVLNKDLLSKINDKRRYVLTWDELTEPAIYTISKFKFSEGFDEDDLDRIYRLSLNDSCTIDNVTVRRIR